MHLYQAIWKRDIEAFKEVLKGFKKDNQRWLLAETQEKEAVPPVSIIAQLSYSDFEGMKPFLETVFAMHPGVNQCLDHRNMTLLDEAIYAKNNPLIDMVFKHESQRYLS